MEIKDLILLMWRNVRYIVLGLVLGIGIGIMVSIFQTPVYEASAKVFVTRTRQQSDSELLSLSDDQLLAINLQLAKSQPVLNDVSSQLDRKINADNIQVEAIPDSQIIQIKVEDSDPQWAATIANLLAKTLVQQNEELLSGWYMGFENAINGQIAQVQKQIEGLQSQISQIIDTDIQGQLTQVNQQIEQLKTETSTLEQDIASYPYSPTPLERISLAEKQARLDQLHSMMTLYQQIQTNLTYIGKPAQNGESLENSQLMTLQSTLDLYQQINITLINSRESVRLARAQSGENVMLIDSAAPPKTPVRPIPVLYVLLGSVVGLALAPTAILMIDYMDASLKSANQIEELFGLPVLGPVIENKYTKKRLITLGDPLSAETDAFRSFGASIEMFGVKENIHTLMIVNADPSDARTTIAANLAVINAQQGKKVVLLDGDIRHPHLHDLFGIENQKGFAELLNNKVDIKGACHIVKDVEGITLIPGGNSENAPTGWMNAEKLARVFSKLQEDVDLVIIDGPPADAADAQILASIIDAVLLVAREWRTRNDAAQATVRRFHLIDAKVAGVVLNRAIQHWKVNNRLSIQFKKAKADKKINPAEVVDNEIETSTIPLS